jgi:hypothetical protein
MYRKLVLMATLAGIFGVNRAAAQGHEEWYRATGNTCSSVDVAKANMANIKTDLYDPKTMISPDSAKIIALCAVPGQIGSGKMHVRNGHTEYVIDVIPDKMKTRTEVVIGAKSGAVLSTKQMGGLRGLAGWIKESEEHNP